MKKIFLSLLALACLVACTPKKTAYEQYIDMYNDLEAQLETVEDRAAKDSLIEGFITDGYTLLMENIEDLTSDSIVLSHFYMLTPEQKAELIAAIPVERWEKPLLKLVYKEYRIELLTSAGNPYIDIVSLKADGTPLALSDLVGKTDYVLVDFWASWCGPCRRLMPALKELYTSYHPSGKLEILGVSCDKDEAAWLQAVEEDMLPWQHIRDQRTEPYNPCDKYGISAIPTTILINKEGVIVGRNLNEAEIEDILSK